MGNSSKEKVLTADETNKLFQLLKIGKGEAREELQLGNLYLVSRALNNFYINNSYDLDELISIGNITLFEAIDNYTFELGIPFEKYALNKIYNSFKKYIKTKIEDKDVQSLYSKIDITSKKVQLVIDTLIEEDNTFPKENNNDLFNAIDSLNPLERQTIMLAYGFKGKTFSSEEISKMLKIDIKKVNNLLYAGLKKIQKFMLKEEIDYKMGKIIIRYKGN